MNQMGSVPQHPVPSPPVPVSFSGDRGQFRRLVMRGTGLELVTVGFYRFWLATDIRRHLWSNTDIGEDAAEYTGTGRELLLGFLFALAILVPIYLIYFLIGLEAERARAFASFPLFLFFYVFGQFAIYRARRYRLTRTVWRGVRFWMSGSGWAYAARAALWGLLAIVTLGLALPWREAALERYKMRHSYYGDLEGSFAGTGWELFRRGWWLWLLGVLVVLIALAAAKAPGVSSLTMLAAPFLYGAFKAVRVALVALRHPVRRGAVRIGAVAESADRALLEGDRLVLPAGDAVLGLCVRLRGPDREHEPDADRQAVRARQSAGQHSDARACRSSAIWRWCSAMNVVMRMYLLRDVWARVISSTAVHNIEAAANVVGRGELASALGEGFADGLDVAGF